MVRMEGLYRQLFGPMGEGATTVSASVPTGRWLMQTLTTASWLAGRLCAALISGTAAHVQAVVVFVLHVVWGALRGFQGGVRRRHLARLLWLQFLCGCDKHWVRYGLLHSVSHTGL